MSDAPMHRPRRSRSRATAAVLAVLAGVAVVGAAPSSGAATRITAPTSSPIHVALDARGKPVPFDIVADGFPAGHLVFIEQCDGRPKSAPNWTPARDCDVGGAPPPAIVDARGVVRFPAADVNHRFQPVLGESPESLFNCVESGGALPKNDLTNYTTCQVRVSTNNVQATDDQVFAAIVFGRSSSGGGSLSAGLIGGIAAGVLLVLAVVAFVRSRRERTAITRAR